MRSAVVWLSYVIRRKVVIFSLILLLKWLPLFTRITPLCLNLSFPFPWKIAIVTWKIAIFRSASNFILCSSIIQWTELKLDIKGLSFYILRIIIALFSQFLLDFANWFTLFAFLYSSLLCLAAVQFLDESAPPKRKLLVVYPIGLFYFVIAWIVVSLS